MLPFSERSSCGGGVCEVLENGEKQRQRENTLFISLLGNKYEQKYYLQKKSYVQENYSLFILLYRE